MTSGRQGPTAGTGLVDRAVVAGFLLKVGLETWFQPNYWNSVKENLGLGFIDDHLLAVPSGALQKQTLSKYDIINVSLCLQLSTLSQYVDCGPPQC